MTNTLPRVLDLHMHSTVSDGTDPPAEILANVKAAGIGFFSLTDHDAIQGCEQLLALLAPGDPLFVPGVEFSCKDELGKYHILGYGYDPAAPSIRAVVAQGHALRMQKVRQRLEILGTEYGFRFPAQEIRALLSLSNPGKPHIAKLMVQHGYAESKEQAFHEFLNKLRVKAGHVRPEEAIRGILGAGGIPVLAHPPYGDGDQLILGGDLDDRTARLKDFGLQGLEGYYSGFSAVLRDQVLHLAEKYGLYVTAGSDYHGKNKLIPLADTGLEPGEVPVEGLRRFFADVLRDQRPEVTP